MMSFNEINEKILEDTLIECMLDDGYPNENKDNNFFLHEFDRSTKAAFLVCNEDFTIEERVFIRNYLATHLHKKLVVGIIINKILFEKMENASYDKDAENSSEPNYFLPIPRKGG
jgi:hypothetical protein